MGDESLKLLDTPRKNINGELESLLVNICNKVILNDMKVLCGKEKRKMNIFIYMYTYRYI